MTDLTTQLDAILHGAAFAPINDRAFLRITGPDATRWLNGMVTNNIKDLAPGEGNYNFLLNAQGRILGDCTIYREPGEGAPTFLLETDNPQLQTLSQTLDKFIIMDDVELAPAPDQSVLLILGPDSAKILNATDIPVEDLEAGEFVQIKWQTFSLNFALARTPSPIVLAYEIWANRDTLQTLHELIRGAGAIEVSPEALEAYRILSGTPKYGTDIRNTETAKDLPQETALNGSQSHALNFNKGCYLGQEIVERIHSRGRVHRTFTPFTLTGSLPAQLPAPLETNGKSAGELTSATQIGDTLYALGYARREALDTHATLTYSGGTATPRKP